MQKLVGDLVQEQLSEDIFLRKYPYPALLFSVNKDSLDSTVSLAIPKDAVTTENLTLARVVFLQKSPRNSKPFVFLGRSSDNDIILEAKEISKSHAFFRQGFLSESYQADYIEVPLEHTEGWFVSDNKSTNGTYLENTTVSEKPSLLYDNCLLSFGKCISCRFFSPSGLWGYLKFLDGIQKQIVDFASVPRE